VRIALVLGAGGSVGVAYHGAVLGAIEEVARWDARTADVIVGTSAGAITGSMLRAGVSARDLMRISEDLPLSPEGTQLAEIGRPHRPRPKLRDLLQVRPVADPRGVLHGLTHPRTHAPGALVAALLPAGGIPTTAISAGIDAVFAAGWPADPLWLCAVALRSGKRVVFGQPGSPQAGVGQAVAASCAIPGYFKPVIIGGRPYVDGGLRSFTNVDLVRDSGFDLVIVSAPMSQASSRPSAAADTLVRRPLRARLHSDVAALRRAGVSVIVIEPDRHVAHAMGLNPIDARPRGAVSRVARIRTEEWLTHHQEGRRLVAMLAVASATAGARTGGRTAKAAGPGVPGSASASAAAEVAVAVGGHLPSA
jgi:NTE family protein